MTLPDTVTSCMHCDNKRMLEVDMTMSLLMGCCVSWSCPCLDEKKAVCFALDFPGMPITWACLKTAEQALSRVSQQGTASFCSEGCQRTPCHETCQE